MNDANPLRIGIPIIADTWLGGVNYIMHLFLAGRALPQEVRPQLVLVVPEEHLNEQALAANRRALPLADTIVARSADTELVRRLLGPKAVACSNENELFEHFDFYYPVQSDAMEGRPAASWIPDFQHKRLPQFFGQNVINYRDTQYREVADKAAHIVFSSKAAQNDFNRFYPGSKALQSVLHFATVPEDSWYTGDPDEVRARYGLPEDYLICCNQFWMHKDHKTLFTAIAALKKLGRVFTLVCTGHTEDYRNKGYFAELKAILTALDIQDQVHILGTIAREDQIQLLRGASAVVHPSLFEGWSTVVEDCRPLGKPLFLTDIDVHLEQAPEHGVFFEAGNPSSLVEAILSHRGKLEPTHGTSQENKAREEASRRIQLFGLQLLKIARQHVASANSSATSGPLPQNKPQRTSRQQPQASDARWPRITIVTPSYNQGDSIEATIRSVLDQGYPNLEYIIMDGGSTDKTVDVIRRFEDRIDHWVSEPDKGQSDAINKGLERATGEIFNWLNSDDWLEPGSLHRLAEVWRENPDAVAWAGGCRRVDPEGRELSIIYPNGMTLENMGENWNGRQFYQPSCFLSTAAVRDEGGVDVSLEFCMDLHLWLRLAKRGRFAAGRGVWTTALIHPKAKTQSMRKEMHLETVRTIKAMGFPRGAAARERHALTGGAHDYVMPADLEQRIRALRNPMQADGLDMTGRRVTVVSNFLPRHDRSSANLRLLEIIRLMRQAGAEVDYLYFYETNDDVRYARDLGIPARRLEERPEAMAEALGGNPPDTLWVSNLWTPEFMALQLESMRTVHETCPATRIVVDTMDLHSQKSMRRFEQLGNPADQDRARAFLALERAVYALADGVVAVSEDECQGIVQAVPESAPVAVVPNIHRPTQAILPRAQRQNLVFLGNYEVDHNADAARHFATEILPHILRRRTDIQIHFAGHGAQSVLKELSGANVRLIGHVPDVAEAFAAYRVFVCPMTYGTGLKGKIGMAAASGLPLVTTSIGAEGFGFTDGEQCFIADAPEEFALKTLHLYDDNVAWNNFSLRGVLAMAERFSPRAVAPAINRIFGAR